MSPEIAEDAHRIPEEHLDDGPTIELALRATPLIDSRHPTIVETARSITVGASDRTDAARRIVEWVRETIPYGTAPGHRVIQPASDVLTRPKATCLNKAVLCAALLRAYDIPTLLTFYSVRDHQIGGEMRRLLRTDRYPWHPVPRLRLRNGWVRVESSINHGLAQRKGWHPVPFPTGGHDELMRPTTVGGDPHWEVLEDRGTWSGVPTGLVREGIRQAYGADTVPTEATQVTR